MLQPCCHQCYNVIRLFVFQIITWRLFGAFEERMSFSTLPETIQKHVYVFSLVVPF